MEFSFSLLRLFGGPGILRIDKNFQFQSIRADPSKKFEMSRVIDDLGIASSNAQKLPGGAITSASKLSFTDQRLYILIEDSSDLGVAVGFIKVGTKKLFVYDHHGVQRECSPLCVLDFYVHETKQRRGYGKMLFDHMIQLENVKPVHLAIDKPSDKFTSFLIRHFNLRVTIPQVNNYVVFDGFFNSRPDTVKRRSNLLKTNQELSRPNERSPSAKSTNQRPPSARSTNQRLPSAKKTNHTQPAGRTTNQNLPANYPANQMADVRRVSPEELEAFSHVKIDRPSSSGSDKNRNDGSPTQLLVGDTQPNNTNSNLLYSRHASGSSSHGSLPDKSTNPRPLSAKLSNQKQTKQHGIQSHQHSQHQNDSIYSEPIRTRDHYQAPSIDRLNSHQDALNRQGHLKVSASAGAHQRAAPTAAHRPASNTTSPNKPQSQTTHLNTNWATNTKTTVTQPHSSWNIFGVPPGFTHISNRK